MIRRDWQQVEQTLRERLLSSSEAASSLRISLAAKILPSKRLFLKLNLFSFFLLRTIFFEEIVIFLLNCHFVYAESPIYLRRSGVGMRRQRQVQVWFQCFLEMVKNSVCSYPILI